MIRTTSGKIKLQKRKKYFRLAKGYVGANSRLLTYASEQIIQSLNSAYQGRKLKKRNFRKIWIYRINTVCRLLETNYSNFIGLIRKKNIYLDRKILSFIALYDINIFSILKNIKVN